MSTRALYYEDSHLTRFSALVRSCTPEKGRYAVTLDATAFYPEGGGQAGDTGTLGTVRVLDTREREGEVIHLCDGPVEVGESVEGVIDYGPRFNRMQQHSGEHIVSGILHSRYGCHNTGFHMGAEVTTIDFDCIIPPADLPEIERLANQAVWKDLPVKCWIPSPEELSAIPYRTKRALPWPVRIVEIPGFDCCACCGTHVKRTGEIGLIKLLSVVNFRGGTRMEMACGALALDLLNTSYEQNKLVSQAFSAQLHQTGDAAQRINQTLAQQKYRISQLERQIFAATAAGYAGQGTVVHFEEGLDGTGLRLLADAIAQVCGGTAAVFSGDDASGYGFCLVDAAGDLRELGRAMVKALNGRGGGKPACQQGRLSATQSQILAFFQSVT